MPRSRPIRALEGRRLLRWDARLCISIGSGLCFDAAGPEGGRLRDFVQLSLGVAGVAVQSGACCVNDACVGNFSLMVEGGGRLFHRWATATGARPTLRRASHRARSSPRQPRPAEMGVGADLQQAGLTQSELERFGAALVTDSEQLAAMGDQLAHGEQLTHLMETVACEHTFMDPATAHEATVRTRRL